MTQLQLSAQIVKDITDKLEAHDPAASDPGVASQYLSAITGFLIGQENMPDEQKQEIIKELGAFMEHVANDVQRQRAEQAPQGSQAAFGIWKPGSS